MKPSHMRVLRMLKRHFNRNAYLLILVIKGDFMSVYSFTKEFKISKSETVERLEKAIKDIKPLEMNSRDAVNRMRERENKLLELLRIK